MDDARAFLDRLPGLAPDEPFRFGCHPAVTCFGECCGDLDCVLHPYDVVRLRAALDQPSDVFLGRHAEVEVARGTGFPVVSLRMRDDAARTCPFVRDGGCTVYDDRPGACRSYPVGRGARLDESGAVRVEYVLVRESHCHGFSEGRAWTAPTWLADQGMDAYLHPNDRHMRLMARWVEERRPLTRGQHDLVLLALYRLDVLRERLRGGTWPDGAPVDGGEGDLDDEAALLLRAFDWVEGLLLRRPPRPR